MRVVIYLDGGPVTKTETWPGYPRTVSMPGGYVEIGNIQIRGNTQDLRQLAHVLTAVAEEAEAAAGRLK